MASVTYTKPTHCPLCGGLVEAVRNISGHIWEMLCESCGVPCVVMVNDFEKVRGL